MASISTYDGGGKRLIEFQTATGRKRIKLGEVSRKDAETIQTHIENLLASKKSGRLEDITADWLTKTDDDMHAKLVRCDLARPRAVAGVATLAAFIDAYIADRTDAKPRTIINLKAARRELVEFFGADKALGDINEGEADEFWRYLLRPRTTGEHQRKAHGDNTARRVCGRAKQFMRFAMRKRIVKSDPFADIESHVQASDKDRDFFITRDMADKVLAKCPNTEWKLIFSLSRYGGLRCPSEHLALKWGDIDFENNRILVHSPKTEHHKGKETRLIPLFPELESVLLAAQSEAAEGMEYVIANRRDTSANLRTGLNRIIRHAGLEPWPKLFHNLRATRETELNDTFPGHVVCEWIGNSEAVAKKHYLRVTDDHFAMASGGENRGGAATRRADQVDSTDKRSNEKRSEKPSVNRPALCGAGQTLPPRGVEPLSSG